MLLPVRVETRYVDAAAGGRELLVRIWPDQVHVDAHDPRLTAAEAEAGRQFWLADWRCGGDQERRRRAWRSLAERFDPARAGWIARATRPENAAARPADAVADTEPPRVLPTFGTVPLTERPSPPVARLLPAAWTATAYAGGQVVAVATGRPITADPAVGPGHRRTAGAPDLDDDDDDEVAAVDTAHALARRLRRGRGHRHGAAAAGGRAGRPAAGDGRPRRAGPTTAPQALGALLDAQRFTAGLGIVEPGTLTNNTDGAPAGWSSADVGSLERARCRDRRRAHWPAARSGWRTPTCWACWGRRRRRRRAHHRRQPHPVAGDVGLLADPVRRPRRRRSRSRRLRLGARPRRPLRASRRPAGRPFASVASRTALLPVTALTRFQGDARETRLGAIVAGLVATGWRPALGKAARVGRGDPAADLVDVLRLDARSDGVSLRRALGSTFAANALDFLSRGVPAEAWRALAARTQPLTQAAGLSATIAGALAAVRAHGVAGRPAARR